MAGVKIPYPPSPADVPEDLADYPPSYRSQQNLLLTGLFMFLLFYMGLIALCILLGTYCAVTLAQWPVVKVAGIGFFGLFFLFLVKGFFKRHPDEKEMRIEITEDEQPVLFGFIHQLCEELGAPEPNRVFVSPDVNAAVVYRSSLINLIVEPKKDLLIGLGLVNCTNLSEFKSVMAHEFGHFCQTGYIGSYSYVASRIILDLIVGEDWFDRMINWCKKQQGAVSAVGYTVGGLMWAARKPLELVLMTITRQRLAVSREQEFHADLVAVKAAGSDAVVLSLMRLRFGNLCLMQSLDDLGLAADHDLYSRDLFYHQDRAEPIVRRKRKDPKLGARPESTDPMAGKDVQIFDPEQEEEDHAEIPEMRRTHPPAHETEENAKATFIPAVVDIRSAWVLFTNTADLKERVTYKFYRMAFKIKKDTELVPPEEVQRFIDDEHAETTYDPKYQGIYGSRPLAPGAVAELNQMIREAPWADDRIEKVFEKLYEGAGSKNEDYQDLRKEKATLENTPGRPSRRIKKKIDRLQDEMDHIWEWFKSLDRRVYLCHVQMAAAVNPEWRDELVERYRFGLEIQRIYLEAEHHANKALFYSRALFRMENPHPETVAEVMQILRQAWRALKNIIQDARDIDMPAMKNFEEGERLADFILDGKMVSEPPLSYVKSKWAFKLVNQLEGVRRRCGRLHWKSVGGILALQEKVATTWQKERAPVEATVVGEPAEVVEAVEVIEALPVVPDEPLEAEIVHAEVLDAEVALDAVVVEDFIGPDAAKPAAVAPPVPATPPKKPTPPSVPVPKPRAEKPPIPAREPAAPIVAPPPPPESEPQPVAVVEQAPEVVPAASVPLVPAEPSVPLPAPVAEAPAILEPALAPVVAPPTPVEPDPVFRLPDEPAPVFRLPDEPVAEILALGAATGLSPVQPELQTEPVAKPAVDAVDEIFSLDTDPAPSPVVRPEPASPPAPSSPVSEDEIFSLDADTASAPVTPPEPVSSLPPSPPVAIDEFFTLDADTAPAPVAPPAPVLPPSPPPPVAVDALFSLDADDHRPAPIVPESPPTEAEVPIPAATAPTPPGKPASAVVPAPAAREKPVAAPSVTKPAKNSRPPVKITFVRPGETSPLGG